MGEAVMNRISVTIALYFMAVVAGAQQQLPPPVEDPPLLEEDLEGRLDAASQALDDLDRATNVILRGAHPFSDEQRAAYNAWVLDYTQSAYAWHHNSTVLIFWVVMLVVGSGVLLAAWQLHAWISRTRTYDAVLVERLKHGEAVDGAMVTGLGAADGGTVSLKSKALAVTSPYVGVVILGLSMGFFLAYLLLVYPVMAGP
jgi:hypothetical protein